MLDRSNREVSVPFVACFNAAIRHLRNMADGVLHPGLRAELTPPFLEHLSFRLGNQLFFVRLEDVQERVPSPGTLEGLLTVAEGCQGHACVMPMRRHADGWRPELPGWGLQDALSGRLIDPPGKITAEPIEVTEWELHDSAVQVVCRAIEAKGLAIMSWQSNPNVDPAIWFVGPDGPEWVIVRAARYPAAGAQLPAHWQAVAETCAGLGKGGSFASVGFADTDTMDAGDQIYRGQRTHVKFKGLVRL